MVQTEGRGSAKGRANFHVTGRNGCQPGVSNIQATGGCFALGFSQGSDMVLRVLHAVLLSVEWSLAQGSCFPRVFTRVQVEKDDQEGQRSTSQFPQTRPSLSCPVCAGALHEVLGQVGQLAELTSSLVASVTQLAKQIQTEIESLVSPVWLGGDWCKSTG